MYDSDFLKQLGREHQRWQETVLQPSLQRYPRARQSTEGNTALPVEVVYSPLDVAYPAAAAEYLPGEYPFRRGVNGTGDHQRVWQTQFTAGPGTPAEANEHLHLLHRGSPCGTFGPPVIHFDFDLPRSAGCDPDGPQARREARRVGVAIDSTADMAELLQGIPLERVFISMAATCPAIILFAFYMVVAERRGMAPEALGGVLQTEPLVACMTPEASHFPPRHALRLASDMVQYCTEHVPEWYLGINGCLIRQAGGDMVQELTLCLGSALANIEIATARGIAIDCIAPRLRFLFQGSTEFLWEIAKLRAARQVWARYMRERLGAQTSRAWMLHGHAQAAGSPDSASQPENNIVRTTIQALAAVLGGTDRLSTDTASGMGQAGPGRRVTTALRVQQILAHESGVTDTPDPLAGAYCIEAYTDALAREVTRGLDQIAASGGGSILAGMLRGLEDGRFTAQIGEVRRRRQQAIASGEQLIVGINQYVQAGAGNPAHESATPGSTGDPPLVERHSSNPVQRRRGVDGGQVQSALMALQNAVAADRPLTPFVLNAARAEATVGEITAVLKGVMGKWA